MRVDGIPRRTIWMRDGVVYMLDQNALPFEFRIVECRTHQQTAAAIRSMIVRGAPAIGAAAAFALAQAFCEAPIQQIWSYARNARAQIDAARPTARDLFAGTERVWFAAEAAASSLAKAAVDAANQYAEASVESCRRIGEYGASLINHNARVLTHCNAGWLATVDYGTALAPIYVATEAGARPYVWVDETRPRGQGARLTAWELRNEGIAHAIIADNASAHFMSRGDVDLVIVGADRVSANGDVVNKIGTLQKAICARAFGIPFYVAVPPSTFDGSLNAGNEVTIEERSADEVHYQNGLDDNGIVRRVRVTSPDSPARNPAFDVTPAHLVTGYITDNGVGTVKDLTRLFANTQLPQFSGQTG